MKKLKIGDLLKIHNDHLFSLKFVIYIGSIGDLHFNSFGDNMKEYSWYNSRINGNRNDTWFSIVG